MNNLPNDIHILPAGETHGEHWTVRGVFAATGLFQLSFDSGGWQCTFSSDDCAAILGCPSAAFGDTLLALTALGEDGGSGQRVETLLRGLEVSSEASPFVCALPGEPARYVGCLLSVLPGPDGGRTAYGQIQELTGLWKTALRLRDLEEKHHAGLQMTNITMYRYEIEGRRGIIPAEEARLRNIPEVIENIPQWNVDCGRIAPDSVDVWLGVFDAIDRGESHGSADVMFLVRNGTVQRRVRVEFAAVADEHGTPASAIVSHKDITDEYERDYRQTMDRDGLLQVAEMSFSEILSINLTKGTYRIIKYDSITKIGSPQEGMLDEMLLQRLEYVAPEDREAFKNQFLSETVRERMGTGRTRVHLSYRRSGPSGILHWMESIAIYQKNPYNNDVLVFAVSRNIDKEKAREELLRRALADSSARLEDQLYYFQLRKDNFRGLDYIAYDDWEDSPYVIGQLADILGCTPRELALGVGERVHPADRENVGKARAEAEAEEANAFVAEYRVFDDVGEMVYISNQAVGFTDREGRHGYIHFVSDVTYEHLLTENLRQRMEEQLAENERVFRTAAQHSNRLLYSFDLKNGTTRPWNEDTGEHDILAPLCAVRYSPETAEQNEYVMPDSVEAVKEFFAEIYDGKPSGQKELHIREAGGQPRWYHFKFTSFFEGDQPVTAMISVEDVTDIHEQRVALMRLQRSLEAELEQYLHYVEVDLTDDRMERAMARGRWDEAASAGERYSDYLNNHYFGLEAQDCADAHALYARENLLRLYEEDSRHLENLWSVKRDGAVSWVMIKSDLIADPISKNIKMFSRTLDVTNRREELLAVSKRVHYDAMTALLRRNVGVERIRERLEEEHAGGILIVVDLDDLKGINDALGHKQGDAAIVAVAEAIKRSFREEDITLRAGGDEFVIYLAGEVYSESAAKRCVASLLAEISGMSVGDEESWRIHCSAGCAMEIPGMDTYETLFERAELALYYVKRRGKNQFAFFEPGMLKDDYELKNSQTLSALDSAVERFTLEDVLFRCMNTLFTESDLQTAVNRFLETVGGYYKAGRAYIYEFDMEGDVFNNSYEWYSPGIVWEGYQLQDLPMEVVGDWITKLENSGGFYMATLVRRPSVGSQEHRLLTAGRVEGLMAAPLRNEGQIVGFIGVDNPTHHIGELNLLRSVSEFIAVELDKRRMMAQLEEMSYTDRLTGLKNRNYYNRVLGEYGRRAPDTLGIIVLDINGLKELNTTYGHEYGDHVIQKTAELLRDNFTDLICRIGGDEFAMICTEVSKEEFQEKMVALRRVFDARHDFGVSMGCAWKYDEENVDINALYQQADEMRSAEKNSYYHDALNAGQEVSSGVVAEAMRDIEQNRFVVYYQPQVDIQTGVVVGAEALIRKLDVDGSIIPPIKFIPFYEVSGVISHIDLFVLWKACEAIRRWKELGFRLHISVNFSRVTLMEPQIVEAISGICAGNNVPPSAIVIEVTESIGKMDTDQLKALIDKLKRAGFSISLDDFGSQYANLSVLASMDFDEVKFDRSLVSTLEDNEKSRLVMKSGVDLCRSLRGTLSLAEGIETREQLDLLREYQCDYGQGYYFSKPIPEDDFERFMKSRTGSH